MPEIIISDTSCLILLKKIGQLQLLPTLYAQIFVTSLIVKEFGSDLPAEIVVRDAQDLNLIKTLSLTVDEGEASAIALAFEIEDSILVLDDRKARKFASSLGLRLTGTLGILLKAKQLGVLPSVKQSLDELRKTDFRISQHIIDRMVKEAGEN
jgi:predicted nucleic acid-binding protein